MSTTFRRARTGFYVASGGTSTPPPVTAGLLAWYSAEAETSYADNAQVTGWTDHSGNGNHAVATGTTKPLWRSSLGPSGGPAIRFGGIGYFQLPTGLMGSATAGEALVAIKADSATQNTGEWSLSPRSFGEASTYPFTDGKIYEAFGLTSGQRKTITPTLSVSSWRRWNCWSSATSWAARLDGITQASASSATVGWDSSPLLGTGMNGSTPTPFIGYMAAFLIYDHVLTSTERSDLDAWLQTNPSGGLP